MLGNEYNANELVEICELVLPELLDVAYVYPAVRVCAVLYEPAQHWH